MPGIFFFLSSLNNAGGPGVSSACDEQDPDREQASEDMQRIRDRSDIQRFLVGDDKGFEDLMNRYRQRAYATALGLTGNHDDAMDAVQKAFINVYRTLDRFRLGEPFFPWLYRIVRNAALNQRRNEGRHKGDIPLEWVREGDKSPDPLQQTELEDLRRRLWSRLGEISPEQREVFVLYHFQGLKYRQIAQALGIPVGTVMSRLHTARMQLRSALGLEDDS